MCVSDNATTDTCYSNEEESVTGCKHDTDEEQGMRPTHTGLSHA